MKLNGLRWILLNRTDAIVDDMSQRPEEWGVSLIAEDNGYRLYRLN